MKAKHMLKDLETLINSGEIELAAGELETDWERRSLILTESLSELQNKDGNWDNVNAQEGAVVVSANPKKVPGRKRSFAAKNREQAMTKGQTRGLSVGNENDSEAVRISKELGINNNLIGISSLLLKSTVISRTDGGAESSERLDTAYYKLHPKKGLIRIQSTPLTLSNAINESNLASSSSSHYDNDDNMFHSPARGQLYSLLSPDQRASRSTSPRPGGGTSRRASASSVSPRRTRAPRGSGNKERTERALFNDNNENHDDDDDDRMNGGRGTMGGSLERVGSNVHRFSRPSKDNGVAGSTFLSDNGVSENNNTIGNDFGMVNEMFQMNRDVSKNRKNTSLGRTGSFEELHSRDRPEHVQFEQEFDNTNAHLGLINFSPKSSLQNKNNGGNNSSKKTTQFAKTNSKTSEEVICSEWALCTVRECDKDDDAVLCFQLISPILPKPIMFQADNEEDFSDWTWAIRDQIQSALDDLKNPGGKSTNTSNKPGGELDEEDEFRNLTQPEITKLLSLNPICADCGQTDPEW
eukprot:CAMPEP_0114379372 /NCGR_PEP_ID=MMETSP0102-20121206/2194_1 /TAXON_ID=38822 ORGANISM="Pteridomonas danica, Strain PT" /NCGR_SAMPLE_ID=MMETSP0102 /ASSEMBLY_ACC=CAM_ASM_000212 /LENGTH=524 /DNA_ID=CAMNT_0001534409 /DNA_START=377 /DNA_END=1950 /DNA_ORIENTATION=-